MKKRLNGLDLPYVIVHWDGKLISDALTNKKIDRLPILICCEDVEEIINVPALEDQTSLTIAKAVYSSLSDWGLIDKTIGVCCDTTASNLGHKAGAVVMFEQMLKRDVLQIACRHHILEIILGAVFILKIPGTNGPKVEIFQRFKDSWPLLDQSKYENGLETLDQNLKDQIPEIVLFVKEYIQHQLPRADYKELLELSLVFLGEGSDITLKKPGACHHARWMAKAIYSLKIFVLRKQFQLSSKQILDFSSICKFIVFVYIRSWYTAPLAASAPSRDLCLIKNLSNYESVDKKISEIALKKLKNHLWYLSPELAALAFFDKNISNNTKEKMVQALNKDPFDEHDSEEIESEVSEDEDEVEDVPENIDEDCPKRFHCEEISIKDLCTKDLEFFIDRRSMKFFSRLQIDTEFLKHNPTTWSRLKSFIDGTNKIRKLKVVNDCAERAVHLTEKYINTLTHDEDQKQYLIQIVNETNKKLFSVKDTKSSFIKKLKTQH